MSEHATQAEGTRPPVNTAPAVDVIVVGGGPAGIMAGFLLARHGVRVLVLEKHGDFLRDFRGDTVHPSTMSALADLGLLETFLARPHHRIDRAELEFDGRRLSVGDLSHAGGPAPFIAMMPQWEFLDFLRDAAEAHPGFALRMNAEVVAVEEAAGRVTGVRLADGERIAAGRLVLMCDGRGSLARQSLPLEDLGAPIDVLWFRVPNTRPGSALRGVVRGDRLLVMIDRGDYWQCAAVIRKGGADALRAQGIAAFREGVAAAAPELEGLADALPDWDAVKLLTVSLDRLTRWHRPGMLAIGDAAHAMSPVGGIGINLAIQDAVTAGNVLGPALARGRDVEPLLARVQGMRMGRTRLIQAAQAMAHRRLIGPLLARGDRPVPPPWLLRRFDAHPLLQRIPGWLIANAAGRQHVKEP